MQSVKLFPHSNGEHLQQIFTGLSGLVNRRLVSLEYQFESKVIKTYSKSGSNAFVNRCLLGEFLGKKIIFDMNDSPDIHDAFLNKVDFYFKRSYSRQLILGKYGNIKKIKPYGFNYAVFPNNIDFFGIHRALKLVRFPYNFITAKNYVPKFDYLQFVPRKDLMESPPNFQIEPKAVFMVRLWDPDDNPKRSDASKEDRKRINENRIEFIFELKKEFGQRFLGGVKDTPFARKLIPELILPNKDTFQKGYLKILKNFNIGIATSGLNNSNGYKLAEYICFSKAIISESLHFQVPGNFFSNKNYFEFQNKEELRDKVGILFDDKILREQMMVENWEYYKNHLEPSQIVLNCLNQIKENG